MRRLLTSVIMLAVLGATTLAGAAVHSGDHRCQMHGMEDCCEVAQTQGTAPEVVAAQLCCLVNCPRPVPTSPAFAVQPAQVSPAPPPALAGSAHAAPPHTAFALRRPARPRPPDSRPAYIQHLALLI